MLAFALSLALTAQTPHDAGRMVRVVARAVGYDQNLKQRAHDKVVIAVLMTARNVDSMSYGEAVFTALSALSGVRVQGIPIEPDTIRFEDLAKLEQALVSGGVDALFIAPGLDKEMRGIVALTRKHQVLSITTAAEAHDVALVLQETAERLKLIVNPPAAKQEGVVFADALLTSATVVGE